VQARGAATIAALRAAGVTVDESARPVRDLGAVHRCYEKLLWPILSGGMAPDEVAELAKLAEMSAPDPANVFDRFTRAVTLRHRDWIAVDEERQQLRRGWAEFFQRFDVLLCPIWPLPAIPHDHEDTVLGRVIRVNGAERPYVELIVWAGLVTMALLPATSVPVGPGGSGLPIGLQIVGPYLEDRTTIDFARRLGELIGGYLPPPGA
jgi:amidase